MGIRVSRMVAGIARVALLAPLMGIAPAPARAGEVMLNLDTKINGATAPPDSTPWLTLDFVDKSNNVVELTITNHLQTAEYSSSVVFNSAVTLAPGDFSYVSGVKETGINFHTDGGSQIKGGTFSVGFSYPSSNGAGGRLSGGTTSVYDITATGLTALSFEALSTGGYYAAADVRAIPPSGSSASIGTTTANAVPEPSTLTLLALGGLGVLGVRRRLGHGRA